MTFKTPEEYLACDEALLDLGDSDDADDVLAVWQPAAPFVVLGYANASASHVDLVACRRRGLPVLRRCSGGGTVLQGPGCFNVSLVLRIRPGPLSSIAGTTCHVLGRHRAMLETLLGRPVRIDGQSDLTLDDRKCAGHAQRRRRRCVLFHGSFLLDADLALMEQVLRLPARAPAYRRGRPHRDFLTTLPCAPAALTAALRRAWGAVDTLEEPPTARIAALVRSRYATDAWNFRL